MRRIPPPLPLLLPLGPSKFKPPRNEGAGRAPASRLEAAKNAGGRPHVIALRRHQRPMGMTQHPPPPAGLPSTPPHCPGNRAKHAGVGTPEGPKRAAARAAGPPSWPVHVLLPRPLTQLEGGCPEAGGTLQSRPVAWWPTATGPCALTPLRPVPWGVHREAQACGGCPGSLHRLKAACLLPMAATRQERLAHNSRSPFFGGGVSKSNSDAPVPP